ncbi:EAL domain-containing protein [Shewanella mesophila]|uniref:EAL domain-containing protein n=1 Tax=Shewanella mesophila TaxID=2864208 RepID=UPI001C65F5B8|nr:EAL domain-containing protein [Shewanella mesophila]QYJ87474.1 EAL domain-containing protein [Shewanella mesophila]
MPNSLIKILILSFLVTCFSGHSYADENTEPTILLNSKTYSVPEGLSQSTVTSIVEGNDGYIWIGTLNGLNRFDGKVFKKYFAGKTTGLPSSFVRSLAYTSGGKLMVGTDKGLVIYSPRDEKFISDNLFTSKTNDPIWQIYSQKEQIIIATEKELIITDLNAEKILKKIEGTYETKQIVRDEKHIYLRDYVGNLIRFNNNFDNKKIISKNVKDIISAGEKILYLTQDSLFEISNGVEKKTNNVDLEKLIYKDGNPYGIKGNVLFNLEHGFGKRTAKKIKNLPETSSISVIYTTDQATHIGFVNKGLLTINDSENIIRSITDSNKNTWHFSLDSNGKILVSSDSKKIKLYDSSMIKVDEFDSGIYGFKNSILWSKKLFIGSDYGLIIIDIIDRSTKKILKNKITYLQRDNDRILAGTNSGEIFEIDEYGNVNNNIVTEVTQPILGLLKISKEHFFITTQSGVFEIKNNKTEQISNMLTYSIAKHKDKILLGTADSIYEYSEDEGNLKLIFKNEKGIYSILSMGDSILASSLSEIVYIKNKKNYIFPTRNGSQYEYNTPSGLAINDETALFGGIDGISLVRLELIDSFLETIPNLRTSIDKLLIFNSPVKTGSKYLNHAISYTENLELKHSDYPFTFKFSSPNANSRLIEHFYQMQGLSDDWIAAQDIDAATYTNLSAGKYNFNVYAKDFLTDTVGPTQSISITITPPWWLSSTAKLVYLSVSLLITFIVIKAILRRQEVQRQIAKSEERLKLSLWGSGDEMWDWDIETGQIYRSNIWGALEFPRDGQRSGEKGEESNIHPMDQERVTNALNKHFYGETDHFEAAYRVKGKDEQWVWILDRAKIVERDEHDKALRMTGTIKNISNFKQAEEQLRLFERAIENISEGMFILDNQFNFVEVNEACCDLCEKSRNDFIGERFQFDLYPESYSQQIRNILQQQGSWSNEVESARGDGSSFLMELTVDAIYDEQGSLSHYVGVFSDISRRKQQEEELRKLTNNDLLTNLPNRSSLMVTLGNLVKKDTHHTLMVLDLDNFKKINDSLGHQVGDELLIKVARRIESTVPYHTSIYRLGGDEFAILVDNNPDIGSSAVIANNVVDAFTNPFELTKDKVVVGVSIGIVLYPEDDQNEQALLRKADIAMYHAKSAGGNRYQFYSESLNRNAIRQLEVENLIREGLRDDLFEVYYQPKIDLKSGKMAGMEALVRLNHPIHGLIPPSDFIPLAEENGLIVEIGEVVLRKACFAAQNWRRQEMFNGRVAVNLSSQQFALPDLQQRIESILRLTQLPAANLELEITEGTVIKQPEKAIKVMMQLSKMGVSLALDDFGTGYSSLSYLKRFPIDTLKIDKAFVDDIDKSDRDLKMVDSIITIAHNMGLSVVGEGVEDASQLSILKALKCEEIQGFIFSKAVCESDFSDLLRRDAITPHAIHMAQNRK